MRRYLLCAIAAVTLFAPCALAQTFDFTPFITSLDPALQVDYTPITQPDAAPHEVFGGDDYGAGVCPTLQQSNWCSLRPNVARPIGTDAAGNVYGLSAVVGLWGNQPWPAGPITLTLYRKTTDGASGAIATISLAACLSADCKLFDQFDSVSGPWIDLVAGTITMTLGDATEFSVTCGGFGCNLVGVAYTGATKVTIRGLPKLFDVILTYVPAGQVLSAVTPGLPDGFRSADSLQVWTGDVRSMPDWSQAQALTCSAATSPAPGQVVTVADTLPDPPIGHGRYYLTASVSGSNRRLGRQYVNGAFSARDPSSLPVCAE